MFYIDTHDHVFRRIFVRKVVVEVKDISVPELFARLHLICQCVLVGASRYILDQ